MLISDLFDLNEAVKWCDVCRSHKDGHCDACGNAWIATEARYRSQSFHFHPAGINGVAGVRSVQKELCVACYRKDFENVNSGAKAPDLPDRGVDPRFHAAQRTEQNRVRVGKLMEVLRSHVPTGDEESVRTFNEDFELLGRLVEVGLRFM